MPIDPTLAAGLQPIQIANPDSSGRMNQLAMLMKMQGFQTENQLNQARLQEAQTAQQDSNALRAMLAGGDLNDPAFQSRVAGMRGGPDVLKSVADMRKTTLEGKAKEAELVDKRLALYGDAAKQAADQPTLEAIVQAKYNDDVLGPILKNMFPVDLALASLRATINNPEKGFEYAKQSTSNLTYKELLEVQNKIKELQFQGRNVAVNEGNLALSRDKYNNPELSYQDTAAGPGAFNPRTGAITPLEMGGKPVGPKVGAEALSPIGKLKRERDSLPPDSPDRKAYDNAIERATETTEAKLDARTMEKREAAYPKATMALKQAQSEVAQLKGHVKDLLDNKEGLFRITGGVLGRIGSVSPSATKAQASLDTILAKGALKSLTDLRAASPTGGALGNVSDRDIQLLKDSIAALQQTQGTKDFTQRLKDYDKLLDEIATRSQDAYDMDYQYKADAKNGTSWDAANGPAPQGGPPVGTVVDGHRFKGGNPNDEANWEVAK